MIRISTICIFACVACSMTFADNVVLKMGAKEWKYLDTGDDPGEKWSTTDFDDSKWKSGQAPLGYGDEDIKQKVSFGDDETDKHVTTFFRRTVNIGDASAAKQFQFQLICDDGCIAYINGKEAFRHNMPPGKVTFDSMAPATVFNELERHKFTFLAAPEKLKSGPNTIAVRVHQRGKESSDLAFDMSLTTLLTDEDVEKAKQAKENDKRVVRAATEQFDRPQRPQRPE